MTTLKKIGNYLLAGLYLLVVVLFFLIKNLVVGVVKAVIEAVKTTKTQVLATLQKKRDSVEDTETIPAIIKDAVQPTA